MSTSTRSLLAVLVIILAAVSISWGLWNASTSRADETVYIATAQSLVTNGQIALNPFFDFYATVFRVLTKDPIYAHLIVRFVNTLLSSLALYYLLTGFKSWIKETALLASTLVWISSYLCSPLTQMGNISLFAASLSMAGFGIALRDPCVAKGLLALFVVMLGALVRKELWLGWMLLAGLLFIRNWMDLRAGKIAGKYLLVFIVGVIALFSAATVARHHAERTLKLSDPNQHAMLAFAQSYGAFKKRVNVEDSFDAMTEFGPVFECAFGKAKTLPQVLQANPREAMTFFFYNSLNNLRNLPGCFFSTRESGISESIVYRPQSALLGLCLFAGGLLVLFTVVQDLKIHHWKAIQTIQAIPDSGALLWRILLLCALACSSAVAFVMVVFVSRHYLPVVPLAFLLLAFFIDRLLRLPGIRRVPPAVILALFAVLFCRPLFAGKGDGNEELKAIRGIKASLPAEPLIGAISAHPFIIYSLDGHGRQATPMTDPKLDPKGLETKAYDLFVVNGNLKGTSVWNDHRAFFENFITNPEKYGYTLFRNIRNKSYLIYIKKS